MKRFGFIFLPVMLCAAVSCDLTENPKDMASTDMVFGSETGLQNYTYGFYNYLPGWGDAYRINTMMDNAAKIQTDTYEVGAYTTNSETSWDWSGIRNVNYFIQHNGLFHCQILLQPPGDPLQVSPGCLFCYQAPWYD